MNNTIRFPIKMGVGADKCVLTDVVLASDYDRDIADLWRQLSSAMKRMEQLKAALDELVALKDWKDKHGKDMEYQRDQPVAWEKARAALAAKEPSDE